MQKLSFPSVLVSVAAACVLSACGPKFDWRDYRSPDAPFSALFPGKPASLTRTIDLDGMKVSMTMTAAEVDGTTFAVGSAELADAAKAAPALAAMKTGLINNIGGTIKSEKAAPDHAPSIELEANGMQNGKPVRLVAHFLAQNKRIYQVIVLGQEKHVAPENVDTFMSSFKLN